MTYSSIRLSNALGVPLLIAFASLSALASGCASETGVVITVSQGSIEQSPDTLRFLMGVDEFDIDLSRVGCETTDGTLLQRFIRLPASDGDVADIADRNLADSPYRLLLKPDVALRIDREMMVAVGAVKDNTLIGVGALQKPVTFVDGKLLQWNIALRPPPSDMLIEPGDRCVCAEDYAGGPFVITSIADPDCDGDIGENDCDHDDASVGTSSSETCGNGVDDDCDPMTSDEPAEEVCDGVDNDCDGMCDEGVDQDDDPYTHCGTKQGECGSVPDPDKADCDATLSEVYPGAPELCDGLDNDCNPDTIFPYHQYCYVSEGPDDRCHVGEQWCDDIDGTFFEECQPLNNSEPYVASPRSCPAYEMCSGRYDPFECANRFVYSETECTLVAVVNANESYLCPGAQAAAPYMGDENFECIWRLLGEGLNAPYYAYLSDSFGEVGPVVDSCAANFHIDEMFGPSEETDFFMWLDVNGEPRMHLRARVNVITVAQPFQCPPPGQAMMCTQPTDPPGS